MNLVNLYYKICIILKIYYLKIKTMQQTLTKPHLRDKMRFKFKQNLAIKTKNLSYSIPSQQKQDSPIKKRLRKASCNLKSFNNIDLRRQMSIKQGFQDCYELQQKIGQGGHSVVYKCRDLKDNKIYAVKVTRKNDPQNLQNLKEQYRILASLDNDGILKGHFLFLNQKKSTCHLICDYYSYPDLRQYMVQHKSQPFDEKKCGQILKSVLESVNYMHEQKICHRDLKPENILYDPITGQTKIIDFQVAKMPRYTHEKLQMWTKAGTPTYRSPQLLKGSYNQVTDLWSLGIIAHQMLIGKFPFKISYERDLLSEIENFNLDLKEANITQSAKNFISKLLKKDPKQRMTAKQALSHPFILSKTVSTPLSNHHKKLNSSFDQSTQQNKDQAQQKISPKSKFYDQNVKLCFLSNIDKDIGIRFCQQQ